MSNYNNNSIQPQSKRRKKQQHQQQQQEYNNFSSTTSNPSIFKLSHLPLRPSTLSLLSRKGFHSTADVLCFSKSSQCSSTWIDITTTTTNKDDGSSLVGGDGVIDAAISNLASELNVSLQEADTIRQEIENAMMMIVINPPLNNKSNSDPTSPTKNQEEKNQTQYKNQYYINSTNVVYFHSHDPKQKRKKAQTASELLSLHYNSSQPSSSSLSSSLSLSTSSRPIISFVRSIDSLLGGGFHTKEVVEIIGLPGVGMFFFISKKLF